MFLLKIILFPFSFIYGSVIEIRNGLYSGGLIKSNKYNIPIICIGNISYGGTGKTPLVEYLVRLLSPNNRLATLSRGYKRKSKGFIIAKNNSLTAEIGDEPKQFKTKFPELMVAACEDRCKGVSEILKSDADTNCVLLDDAFQHRSLKAGLNILLSDYNNLYTRDFVLPSGTLREHSSSAKRADIIIITKCPQALSPEERRKISNEINPSGNQHLFFSYIEYDSLKKINDFKFEKNFNSKQTVLLFSGIANIKPLEQYFKDRKYSVISLIFKDHHQYSIQDLSKIRNTFNNIADENKIILTTEKDIMRIETPAQKEILTGLPVFYIPIKAEFFEPDKEMFNKIIIDYVTNFGKDK